MKLYELTCLISPDISEEELKNFQEKIISLIQEVGILINSMLPKKRFLAYPIKKNNSAFFTTLNFQMKPEDLVNFEKKLKLEQAGLIRYLILAKVMPKAIQVRKKPYVVTRKIAEPKKEKVKIEKIEQKLKEVLGES